MLMFGCLYNNENIHVDTTIIGCLYNNETIHVDVWLFIQ